MITQHQNANHIEILNNFLMSHLVKINFSQKGSQY